MAEIYRVLKPQGRLLVLVIGLPARPMPRTIAKKLLGGTPQHDLGELIPLMEASGFSKIEHGQVKFHILGLSLLAFVRGSARKS